MGSESLTGVAETALGAAMLRAEEGARLDRLFDDPFAAAFVAAAPPIFADGPDPGDPQVAQLRRAFTDQLAIRTRFYDDYVVDAVNQGCAQVVLLGAGLDTRAFRLVWPDGTRVFELDQASVLSFKQRVLDAENAIPACERITVDVDLAEDWTVRLLGAGFNPRIPSAWTAEGLLSYLSDDEADALLTRVTQLSTQHSRFAAEAARITDDATLVEASRSSSLAPIAAMWQGGLRDDPGMWLEAHDWIVQRQDRARLAAAYGRPLTDSSTGGFLVARKPSG